MFVSVWNVNDMNQTPAAKTSPPRNKSDTKVPPSSVPSKTDYMNEADCYEKPVDKFIQLTRLLFDIAFYEVNNGMAVTEYCKQRHLKVGRLKYI